MCVIFSFQIIAFDELKTDYKNPIDQCNSLNPVSIFFMHVHLSKFFVNIFFVHEGILLIISLLSEI